MVVGCPRCKCKLKVPDEKIKPEGSRFKCPSCSAILVVKKPEPKARELDRKKVVVAHEDAAVLGEMKSMLSDGGYGVLAATDGVDVMVKAMKDLPYLAVLDIALPKINGFEVAKRLKAKPETKAIKVILVSSRSDPARQRKNPPSAYGVDAYVDDDQLKEGIALLTRKMDEKAKGAALGAKAPASPSVVGPAPRQESSDMRVERAKRLARTVLSDIELYSPQKVADAIRKDSFETVFADELKEGLKHYENRIPPEVRNLGNFFQDAVDTYIASKKKDLGIA